MLQVQLLHQLSLVSRRLGFIHLLIFIIISTILTILLYPFSSLINLIPIHLILLRYLKEVVIE